MSLKGNRADFKHQSLFTGLESTATYAQKEKKPSVATGEPSDDEVKAFETCVKAGAYNCF